MKRSVVFLLGLLWFNSGLAQDIPRQGFWSVALEDNERPDGTFQPVVKRLHPKSTEGVAGLMPGDTLLQINDWEVRSSSYLRFSGMLNNLRAGDSICFRIIRAGGPLNLCGTVQGRPMERREDADVIYDQVAFEQGYLRTIITRPNSDGKLPAIYFLPGYNCASYDNMFLHHPYRRIIDSLTALGYAVFRCEKSGMGDSYNTPNCYEIDFHTEQQGFEAGYRKLLTYDFIDTSRIILFGHSLGGINAPLLAKKFQPRGVVVYGTTHLPWMEYLYKMVRFQNPMLGIGPLEMEKDMKVYQTLLYELFVLKTSPSELVAKDSAYLPLLKRDFMYSGGDLLLERDQHFMQQLNELDLTTAWSQVRSNVLSIYGQADFEALDPSSHQEIARIVNRFHPGMATFLLLPETDHSFIRVGSMEEGVQAILSGNKGKLLATRFNYEVVTQIDQWIKTLK